MPGVDVARQNGGLSGELEQYRAAEKERNKA